ncbi:MAG: alpha/beta hydrolase [Flavobacterium sp.]|nr:alpha/beta hydrolase [Flavobacterium sp.]
MAFNNVKTDAVNVNGTKFYYRKLGTPNESVPVIFLNHLGATLDNCDPRIMDGIASKHQIIAFDNRGVGATEGKTPITIAEMAKDAIGFIKAMGFEKVDIIGFSMGAFVAQEILLQEPQLVRKVVMTGTGPAGGEGIKDVSKITYWDMFRGYLTFRDPKFYLFFNQNENGKKAAKEFLARIKERTENRDEKIKLQSFGNQLKAIHSWGTQKPQDLSVIQQPVLIVNGDNDRMVPSSNTYDLAKRISNSELIVYKDAGHGGIFQNHEEFVKSALAFLAK